MNTFEKEFENYSRPGTLLTNNFIVKGKDRETYRTEAIPSGEVFLVLKSGEGRVKDGTFDGYSYGYENGRWMDVLCEKKIYRIEFRKYSTARDLPHMFKIIRKADAD